MAATTDPTPAEDISVKKTADSTPHDAPSTAAEPDSITTKLETTSLEPAQPPLQVGPDPVSPIPISVSKVSTATNDISSTLVSPSSTTPVLEKQDMDFVGNVDVNNDIPTDRDFERVKDLLVLDSKGQSRPFKELYSAQGVAPRQLIIFIRHFFCGNCQEYLRTLSSSITPEELLRLPTPTFITVIGCGQPELIEQYAEISNCPFPIYADPTRKLYDYLYMTRTWDLGKKPQYFQSNVLATSIQSIAQALKTGSKALKGGDFKQVGGEFMFEDGKCVWVHRMRNTRDHAEVSEVRRVLGLDDAIIPVRKRWSHNIKEDGKGKRSPSWGRGRSKSKSKDGKRSKEGSIKSIKEEDAKMIGAKTM